MPKRKYSDVQVTNALIALAANKNDYKKTAKDCNVPLCTLKDWARTRNRPGVGELLKHAIEKILLAVPDNLSGKDWAITVGILFDKFLLLEGYATARTETTITNAKQMTPEEREKFFGHVEGLLQRARSSNGHTGSANGHNPVDAAAGAADDGVSL